MSIGAGSSGPTRPGVSIRQQVRSGPANSGNRYSACPCAMSSQDRHRPPARTRPARPAPGPADIQLTGDLCDGQDAAAFPRELQDARGRRDPSAGRGAGPRCASGGAEAALAPASGGASGKCPAAPCPPEPRPRPNGRNAQEVRSPRISKRGLTPTKILTPPAATIPTDDPLGELHRTESLRGAESGRYRGAVEQDRGSPGASVFAVRSFFTRYW